MAGKRTVTSVYGRDAADRLAALAIDLACAAPEKVTTYMTRVPSFLMAEAREALEDIGIDWRALVRNRVKAEREAGYRMEGQQLVHQRLNYDTVLHTFSSACKMGRHSYCQRADECECACHEPEPVV